MPRISRFAALSAAFFAALAVVLLVASSGCSSGSLPVPPAAGGGGGQGGGQNGGGNGGDQGGGDQGGGGEQPNVCLPDRECFPEQDELFTVALLGATISQMPVRVFTPLAYFDPTSADDIQPVSDFIRHLGEVDGQWQPWPFPPGWECEPAAAKLPRPAVPASVALAVRLMHRSGAPVTTAQDGEQTWNSPSGVTWKYTETESEDHNTLTVDARGTDDLGTDLHVHIEARLTDGSNGKRVEGQQTVSGLWVTTGIGNWFMAHCTDPDAYRRAISRIQIRQHQATHTAERNPDCSIDFTVRDDRQTQQNTELDGSTINDVASSTSSVEYSGWLSADMKTMRIDRVNGWGRWNQLVGDTPWWLSINVSNVEGAASLTKDPLTEGMPVEGDWTSLSGDFRIQTCSGITGVGSWTLDSLQGDIHNLPGHPTGEWGGTPQNPKVRWNGGEWQDLR